MQGASGTSCIQEGLYKSEDVPCENRWWFWARDFKYLESVKPQNLYAVDMSVGADYQEYSEIFNKGLVPIIVNRMTTKSASIVIFFLLIGT